MLGAFAPCCRQLERRQVPRQSGVRSSLPSAEEYPSLDYEFCKLSAGIKKGASACKRYQLAFSQLGMRQCEQAVASWKAEDYSSLKELGLVVNPAIENAEFVPFETMQLPMKTKAVFETGHPVLP
eukprot:3979397-Pleurochrysis_carterae.AAC.2